MLGLTTIIHTTHDHMFFYLIWAIFGGLSTLKMVFILHMSLDLNFIIDTQLFVQ